MKWVDSSGNSILDALQISDSKCLIINLLIIGKMKIFCNPSRDTGGWILTRSADVKVKMTTS